MDISATISGNGFSTANNAAVSSSGNFYGNNVMRRSWAASSPTAARTSPVPSAATSNRL